VGTIATTAAALAELRDDDDALVAAVRAGDDRAFEALFARHHGAVTAYARGMLRDHARAEDVAQDVFVAALRRLRATDGPIAFKPWIHEIAKNACIDAWRRSSRAELVSYDAGEDLGAADRGRLVSGAPAPDAEVDTRLELDQLKGAFEGLSDAHHEILVMRELHGYTYRQIGERLGMSPAAVESTLFRARRRLGEEFEQLGTGAACRRSVAIVASAEGTGRVGGRDELRLARHVAHCRPCRRAAAVAGFDLEALAARKGLRAKIASLLPAPAWARRFIGGADVSRGPVGRTMEAVPFAVVGVEPAARGASRLVAAVVGAVAVAGIGAGTATQIGRWTGSDESANAAASRATRAAHASPPTSRSTAVPRSTTGSGRTRSGAAPATTARSAAAAAGHAPAAGAAGSAGGSSPLRTATAAGAIVPSVKVPGARQVVRNPVGTATGAVRTVRGTTRSLTGTASGTVKSATGTASKAAGQVTSAATRTAGQVTGGVSKTTGQVTGGVPKTAGQVTGAAAKTTGQVTGAAAKTAGQVTGTAAKTTSQIGRTAATTAAGSSAAAPAATGGVTGTAGKVLGG
jgi:RNA polymerase sigma factor (sigma-70 family)